MSLSRGITFPASVGLSPVVYRPELLAFFRRAIDCGVERWAAPGSRRKQINGDGYCRNYIY